MASESGYSNQKKLGTSQFKTIQSVGSSQFGAPIVQKSLYDITTVAQSIVSVTDVVGTNGQLQYWNVEITGHTAVAGNILRMITGTLKGFEFEIVSIIDANNFTILPASQSAPIAAETAKVMGWVTAKSDEEGNASFSPGPTQFIQNSVAVEVNEDTANPANNKGLPVLPAFYKDGTLVTVNIDTATPANNRPLPVEIANVSGSVTINAGDLSVAIDSTNDSVAIGDSVTGLSAKVDANATTTFNELHVSDDDAIAELQDINTSLGTISAVDYATETTLLTVATEVTLDAVKTAVESIALEDFATEVTLNDIKTSVELIDDSSNVDGNPAGTAGLMIGGKDGAGDFQQASVNTAGELSVTFGAAGFATETTLSALNAKVANDFGAASGGVRTTAQVGNAAGAADFGDGVVGAQTLRVAANLKRAGNDLSYNAGVSDANTLRVNVASDSNLAKAAQLPSALGQLASAASLAAVLSTEQEVILNAIKTAVETSAAVTNTGTITNTQATVGLTAVRATVSGAAPSAARKKLLIKPSKLNSGAIYLGSSAVTTANGLEIIGPDRLEFVLDASDYYLISDTAAQVCEIIEVV